MLDPTGKSDLATRTRTRSEAIWVGMLSQSPLSPDEALLNLLHQDRVKSYLALTDEVFEVKEYEQAASNDQSLAEINQELFLAQDKAAAERLKIANRLAAENYLHAARMFDAQVRAVVMAAQEYAGQMAVAQLGAEAGQVAAQVAREGAHLEEIQTRISIEVVDQAMVQAELARSQLQVAQAGVKAVMADNEAAEAEVQVVEAQVQIALTTAEMATLQAEVALILAEVITKQLSKIRLGVMSEEIGILSAAVAEKLGALLTVWSSRSRVEDLRTQGATQLVAEVAALLTAEVAGTALEIQAGENAVDVATKEQAASTAELATESGAYAGVVSAKTNLFDTEYDGRTSAFQARAAAAKLINAAKVAVYGNRRILRYVTDRYNEYISGG